MGHPKLTIYRTRRIVGRVYWRNLADISGYVSFKLISDTIDDIAANKVSHMKISSGKRLECSGLAKNPSDCAVGLHIINYH